MIYRLLADLVVFLHFAFIVFVAAVVSTVPSVTSTDFPTEFPFPTR